MSLTRPMPDIFECSIFEHITSHLVNWSDLKRTGLDLITIRDLPRELQTSFGLR